MPLRSGKRLRLRRLLHTLVVKLDADFGRIERQLGTVQVALSHWAREPKGSSASPKTR